MNLLIVDDETTTRNGLIRHVNWSSFGIQNIELAASGMEALERCSSFAPDIILSDIRMPEMNGIELCRRLRTQYPDCVILFLSGYSDKEYLHSAIDLGAVDYIEKPIDLEEMEKAVKKAADLVHRSHLYNRSYGNMHQMISRSLPIIRKRVVDSLTTPGTDENQYMTDLEYLNTFSDLSQWFTVLIVRYPRPVRGIETCEKALTGSLSGLLIRYEYLQAFKDDQSQVLILASPAPASLPHYGRDQNLNILMAAHSAEEMNAFCAVGRVVHGIRSVCLSYADALTALKQLFYHDYGLTLYYTGERILPLVFDRKILDQFSQCLTHGDFENAVSILESVYQTLHGQNNVPPSEICSIYHRIGHLIEERRRQLSSSPMPSDPPGQSISETSTLKEIHSFYKGQLMLLLTDSGSENSKRIILQVQRYIEDHYSDAALSVKEISKAVYLSPNYMSNLFKRETGASLVEYIRDIRIRHSISLLRDDSLKLYHIALKVGFTDANYYTKMFKKVLGVTPSEYKEHHL